MTFVTLFVTVFLPGKPLFSIDIHPDGSRFATGGQGIVECNSCYFLVELLYCFVISHYCLQIFLFVQWNFSTFSLSFRFELSD